MITHQMVTVRPIDTRTKGYCQRFENFSKKIIKGLSFPIYYSLYITVTS